MHGPGQRRGGVHGHWRRNRQGFSKGQAAPRSSWSSARAPAKPLRSAGRRAHAGGRAAPSLGPLLSPPQPRPSAARPSRSGWRAGSEREAGSNWCLPGTQLRPSREQKQPPAPEPGEGGLQGGGAAPAPGNPAPEMGHPRGVPPNFPPLRPGSGRAEAGGQGAESARSARGARNPAAGVCAEGERDHARGTGRGDRRGLGAPSPSQGRGREVGELETYCNRPTRSRRRPARPPAAWRAAARGWDPGWGRGWSRRLRRAGPHPRRPRGRRRRGCGGRHWPRPGARRRPGAQRRGARRPGAGPAGSGGSSRRSA